MSVWDELDNRAGSIRVPSQPADPTEFEVWADLVEADSILSGLIRTMKSRLGKIDKIDMQEARDLLSKHAPNPTLSGWKNQLVELLNDVEMQMDFILSRRPDSQGHRRGDRIAGEGDNGPNVGPGSA